MPKYRYRYVKSVPSARRHPVFLSFFLIAIGIGMLFWVSWPIVAFQLSTRELLSSTVSPLQNKDMSSLLGATTDSSNPNLWYPTTPQKSDSSAMHAYKLSIPKLKIFNATVVVSGDSLDTNLIHYGGTARPGEFGTGVVFGHSTLPQLYDPKNYKTIFTYLPTLTPAKGEKPGDVIIINYDGVEYHYMVEDMYVTKPNDLSPLEQQYDGEHLTLITCVPPGTMFERLIVKTRLLPPT